MAMQNFKRNLLLILYREKKNLIHSLFPLAALREIKIVSDTWNLFPPFGGL